MTRRILTPRSSTVLAVLLALASGGPKPRSHAQSPAPKGAVIERWDTYPADSVERQRVVGRLLLTLRPGMTRQQVEAIVGPADEPRDLVHEGEDGRTVVSKLYCCLPPCLPEPPNRSCHGIMVAYDTSGPVPMLLSVGHAWSCGFEVLIGPKH